MCINLHWPICFNLCCQCLARQMKADSSSGRVFWRAGHQGTEPCQHMLWLHDLTANHCVNFCVTRPACLTGAVFLPAGCCFLLGGTKHKHQQFNTMLNKACCSLLLLACIGLIIPTAAERFFQEDTKHPDAPYVTTSSVANMSHATALILGFV